MDATKRKYALVAHEAANLFPMMAPGEYIALKDDIQDHGLREPVVVYKGEILDGRNRYKACGELGINADLLKLDDHDIGHDPIAYVVSANLRRRHLTDAQRAMVAVELEKLYSGAIKEKESARKSKSDYCTGAIVTTGTAASA